MNKVVFCERASSLVARAASGSTPHGSELYAVPSRDAGFDPPWERIKRGRIEKICLASCSVLVESMTQVT
jgi:hypothetical protein